MVFTMVISCFLGFLGALHHPVPCGDVPKAASLCAVRRMRKEANFASGLFPTLSETMDCLSQGQVCQGLAVNVVLEMNEGSMDKLGDRSHSLIYAGTAPELEIDDSLVLFHDGDSRVAGNISGVFGGTLFDGWSGSLSTSSEDCTADFIHYKTHVDTRHFDDRSPWAISKLDGVADAHEFHVFKSINTTLDGGVFFTITAANYSTPFGGTTTDLDLPTTHYDGIGHLYDVASTYYDLAAASFGQFHDLVSTHYAHFEDFATDTRHYDHVAVIVNEFLSEASSNVKHMWGVTISFFLDLVENFDFDKLLCQLFAWTFVGAVIFTALFIVHKCVSDMRSIFVERKPVCVVKSVLRKPSEPIPATGKHVTWDRESFLTVRIIPNYQQYSVEEVSAMWRSTREIYEMGKRFRAEMNDKELRSANMSLMLWKSSAQVLVVKEKQLERAERKQPTRVPEDETMRDNNVALFSCDACLETPVCLRIRKEWTIPEYMTRPTKRRRLNDSEPTKPLPTSPPPTATGFLTLSVAPPPPRVIRQIRTPVTRTHPPRHPNIPVYQQMEKARQSPLLSSARQQKAAATDDDTTRPTKFRHTQAVALLLETEPNTTDSDALPHDEISNDNEAQLYGSANLDNEDDEDDGLLGVEFVSDEEDDDGTCDCDFEEGSDRYLGSEFGSLVNCGGQGAVFEDFDRCGPLDERELDIVGLDTAVLDDQGNSDTLGTGETGNERFEMDSWEADEKRRERAARKAVIDDDLLIEGYGSRLFRQVTWDEAANSVLTFEYTSDEMSAIRRLPHENKKMIRRNEYRLRLEDKKRRERAEQKVVIDDEVLAKGYGSGLFARRVTWNPNPSVMLIESRSDVPLEDALAMWHPKGELRKMKQRNRREVRKEKQKRRARAEQKEQVSDNDMDYGAWLFAVEPSDDGDFMEDVAIEPTYDDDVAVEDDDSLHDDLVLEILMKYAQEDDSDDDDDDDDYGCVRFASADDDWGSALGDDAESGDDDNIDLEAVEDEPVEDEPVEGESLEDGLVEDGPVEDEPLEHEPADDEPVVAHDNEDSSDDDDNDDDDAASGSEISNSVSVPRAGEWTMDEQMGLVRRSARLASDRTHDGTRTGPRRSARLALKKRPNYKD